METLGASVEGGVANAPGVSAAHACEHQQQLVLVGTALDHGALFSSTDSALDPNALLGNASEAIDGFQRWRCSEPHLWGNAAVGVDETSPNHGTHLFVLRHLLVEFVGEASAGLPLACTGHRAREHTALGSAILQL